MLTSRDMSSRKHARNLSEWRCVMKEIEISIVFLWKENPNMNKIVEMYEKAIFLSVKLPPRTENGKVGSLNELC